MRINTVVLLGMFAGLTYAGRPDANAIVAKSVAANQRDFDASANYNYKERDRNSKGDKTYQVTMIEGSPYSRLIAVNGKPLPPDQNAAEQKKETDARQQRKSESPADREKRIQKYQRDQQRDQAMMNQLTKGFSFTLVGQRAVNRHSVWVLRATPRPGYQPPDRDSQVLTGMEGELWIDQKSNQWVRVTAQVIHPVSIEGFLAQVQPGTRFELEKSPVGDGSVWMPSHFAERASAKILFMVSHQEHEDNSFWDYRPAK